jgi:hypothetical protein
MWSFEMQLVIDGQMRPMNKGLGLGAIFEIVETLERDYGYTSIKSSDVIALTKGTKK